MSRSVIAFLTLMCCIGCGRAGQEIRHSEVRRLIDAEVIARSVLPPFTGVVRTWVVLTVREDGTQLDILLPYFSAEQVVPRIGELCDFSVSLQDVDGLAGDKVVNATANIVDQVQCHDAK